MLASVCIKYVHNYSFPSILNSARASYSRRHRLTDANTRILRSLGKVLTVKWMCVFTLQDSVCRVAEEPFRCCDTGFPVVWERLFYCAERAFLWCGRMVVASRYCEECPPEWVLWRCRGWGGAGEEGANACSERFLFSLLKVKNVMIFYCPYCINIHFRQCRAAMFSHPYIRPARLSDCFVMPKKHSNELPMAMKCAQ